MQDAAKAEWELGRAQDMLDKLGSDLEIKDSKTAAGETYDSYMLRVSRERTLIFDFFFLRGVPVPRKKGDTASLQHPLGQNTVSLVLSIFFLLTCVLPMTFHYVQRTSLTLP